MTGVQTCALPILLRESFDSAIEKADAENVRIIFEEVNNLNFEDETEIYNIAKIILNRMIASGGGRWAHKRGRGHPQL